MTTTILASTSIGVSSQNLVQSGAVVDANLRARVGSKRSEISVNDEPNKYQRIDSETVESRPNLPGIEPVCEVWHGVMVGQQRNNLPSFTSEELFFDKELFSSFPDGEELIPFEELLFVTEEALPPISQAQNNLQDENEEWVPLVQQVQNGEEPLVVRRGRKACKNPLSQDEKAAVLRSLRQDPRVFSSFPPRIRNNREVMIAAAELDVSLVGLFKKCSVPLDLETALVIVRRNPEALRYFEKHFQNNKDVVLAAVEQDGLALWYASVDMRRNKEVALAAVKQNGLAIQYVQVDWKDYKEVALVAVNQNGLALQYVFRPIQKNAQPKARLNLKDYKEVTLVAIKQNSLAFDHTSPILKDDIDVKIASLGDVDWDGLKDCLTFSNLPEENSGAESRGISSSSANPLNIEESMDEALTDASFLSDWLNDIDGHD